MDFIQSILPVIDNTRFARTLADSTQLKLLHEHIRKGKVHTDDEAMIKLYGIKGSHQAYKKLKQRFRDKLTEYVLLNGVAFKNLDAYARIYRKCMTQVMAIKTLILGNARVAAVNIGENLIKTTLSNEYTDLTLLLSRELFSYYTAINYHPLKSQKYEKIMERAQQLYSRELKSNKYFCDLKIVFNTSRGSQKEKSDSMAISYCNEIMPYLQGSNTSYQLLYNVYSVMAMRYELAQDYKRLLQICDEATNAFKERRISRKAGYYQFDVYKIVCFLQLQEYSKVEIIADAYFREMTRSSLNWFVLKIYIMVCRLHSRNYQGAYNVVQEVVNEKGYRKLPGTILQSWIVYEAHVEFLISIGKIKTVTPLKFRLYKFLNEIPIYTKDKRGLNIAILIVHALILLQQRKYMEIIDRVDALNQYCHRHLRRDDTFRSNCFIKMLLRIPKADFNRKRTERYALPYLNKLHSMPLMISDQSMEVEVIPYEDLWEMVLELLD
ncbi:MAG TPA: hypothetical protein VI603_07705 [Saprospiraceae bacterium]|nr:hypothetical protein [Saprospiraceae bacterium]